MQSLPSLSMTLTALTQPLLPLFVLTVLSAQPVMADIYKCSDTDGRTVFSNQNLKNCKRLSFSGDTSGSTSGAADTSAPPRASTSSKPRASQNPTPSDFPKVNTDAQKTRDGDRRRILEEELGSEQRSLDSARQELNAQRTSKAPADKIRPLEERVAQHERNVAQLNRELSKLK